MSKTRRIEVDIRCVTVGKVLPDVDLYYLNSQNALVNTVRDVLGNMLMEIDFYFAAVVHERIKINERWPKDWWQAFKERWFPRWALRRWPVQYRTIDVDRPVRMTVCPHLAIDPRKEHLSFILEQMDREKDA